MNGKAKSRISIRNLFRIETGKKIILGLLVCAVVFGAYVGIHKLTSKAGTQYVTKGVVNDLSELNKDRSKKLGTVDNPFVVLEIVPWSGYGEFGYLIDGCEPVDYRSIYTGNSMPGNIAYGQLQVVKSCFEEEEHPTSWKKVDDDNGKELYGYYERVEDGTGKFSIDGYTKINNKYEPKFKKEDGGDFVWVSLSEGSWGINLYDSRVKENKYANSQNTDVKFVVGDRQYTTRKELSYYQYNNTSNPEVKYVFYNDFMRESLKVRSQKEIDNYQIVVKVIEPSELNANPEWVYNADLIYMHKKNKYGATVSTFWKDTQSGSNAKYRKVRQDSSYYSTYEGSTFGYYKNGDYSKAKEWGADDSDVVYWQSHQNDISWEVAYNIFLKSNKCGKYNNQLNITDDINTPLIIESNLFDETTEYESKEVDTSLIDYEKMSTNIWNYMNNNEEKITFKSVGYNNNVYKLCLMNMIMDQECFYNLFMSGDEPVINEGGDTGICSIQKGDAQSYWNTFTFMTKYFYEKNNIWNAVNCYHMEEGDWLLAKNKYKIFFNDSGLYYNGNKSIIGVTFLVFNNDNTFTLDINSPFFTENENTKNNIFEKDIFEWYKKNGDPKDKVSTLDAVYYMLNPQNRGVPGDVVRRANSFNVLDIEPCSDYSTLTDTLVRAMFPPSKYKSNIHIDRMTVAEFNSSKISLKTNYDVVYIGKDTGKMNSDNKGTVYNDPSLDRNIYMHVGDTFDSASEKGTYRTSGNDFTTPSLEKLVSFARSGNIILLPDEFYMKSSSFNQVTYNNILGKDKVTGNTDLNVLKFLDKINEGEFKDNKNITCISEQSKKNAALATFVADSNTDFVIEKDSDGNEKDVLYKGSDGKYHMDFSFVIGKCDGNRFKVKLLIDKNGDGVFTEDENSSEVVKTWPEDAGTYGESSKKDGRYVPYKVTYNFPKNYNRGNVSWKFVIYNTDADKKDAYIERTGISVYNGRKASTKVNVLQIVSDKDIDNKNYNLQKQLEATSSNTFKKYVDGAEGYKIAIDTKSVSQYRDMFKDKDQKFVVDGNAHYYSADLDDYNLVIVSCGDDLSKDITKDDMNSTGNVKYSALAYLAYLDTVDQSVIYTSNTVNGSNTASQKVIKDAFNLSRFTSAGANNSMYTDKTKFYHKKKGEYQDADNAKSGEIEHTYYAVMKDYDNSIKKGHYVYKDSIWGNIQSSGKTLDTQKAVSIDRNNKGAITSYPYEIDPNISIKGAEAQQYVLNLNNPYATVWFTLADKKKQKETYTEKDPETGKEVEKEREKLVDTDKAYGISPRDGANNYYLYNTGNVFYTGIDLSQDNNDEEIKLFINTIVAASGSASQYPSVTIDDVKDDEKEGGCEPNPQLVVDKKSKKEYQFDVLFSGRKAIDAYKEYRPDATSEPTATIKPGDDEDTPTPTVKPTEKPVTDPSAPADNSADGRKVAVLYNNKFASSDGYYYCKDAEWMKNLPNDAFIQIQYTSIESVSKDKKSVKIEVEGSSGAEGTIILRACENDGSETEDIQKVNVPVSTLKSSLGSAGASISGITIRPFEWNNSTVILSVRLIGSDYSGDFSASSSHNDAKDSREKEVKEVEKHTHRIFFTACDGILDYNSGDTAFNLTPIGNVSIAITDGMYGSETIAVPVEKIYRTTGDTNYMIDSTLGEKDSPNAGKFTKANGTHLMNDVQYFVAYDKAYALGGTPYLRFTIENDKHKSVTYLQAVDKSEPPKDDVYMFDLD